MSSSSVLVSWEPPQLLSRNGQLRTYVVYITEIQKAYLENGSILLLAPMNGNKTFNASNNHTHIIDKLHPSYEYRVRVAAATITGIGPSSLVLSGTLPQDGMFKI